MTIPKPIRFDRDTWLCIRNDPILPKALIRRDHTFRDGKIVDVYRVFRWDLDPAKRVQVSGHWTLEDASDSVKFDPPKSKTPPGGVNGPNAPRAPGHAPSAGVAAPRAT